MKENTYLVKDPFHSHPLIRTIFPGLKKPCDVSVLHMLFAKLGFFYFISVQPISTHLCITICFMTKMKDLAVKGLPAAPDLRALSVANNGNSPRNPLIQFCRAA